MLFMKWVLPKNRLILRSYNAYFLLKTTSFIPSWIMMNEMGASLHKGSPHLRITWHIFAIIFRCELCSLNVNQFIEYSTRDMIIILREVKAFIHSFIKHNYFILMICLTVWFSYEGYSCSRGSYRPSCVFVQWNTFLKNSIFPDFASFIK